MSKEGELTLRRTCSVILSVSRVGRCCNIIVDGTRKAGGGLCGCGDGVLMFSLRWWPRMECTHTVRTFPERSRPVYEDEAVLLLHRRGTSRLSVHGLSLRRFFCCSTTATPTVYRIIFL